ncbi:SDR family NAD(P)-dependent oxidoreductase [Candidatus Poriferisocius sp.]|uniref:SDR family NAD(P)-dependent oxidoreductase n=1 Tax=Candidatus Poriferisocius sp. TaxID=3101276 RepID=UPI003B5C70D8
MNRFQDKVAIVTGAASGIGQATAARLRSEGATVVGVDRDPVSDVDLAIQLDLLDVAAIQPAVDQVIAAYGRIDVLCNIAGLGHFIRDEEETLEGWNRTIGVNLTGTYFMSTACLPHLIESKGAIVNTASTAGTNAQPWSSAYSASKGGVIALTQTMAITNGKTGVRVNCIAPGGVETPITEQFLPPDDVDLALMNRILPFDRMGRPAELAAAFAFLAGDDASYCNGIILRVDGGMQA